jgi:hypothetical protein
MISATPTRFRFAALLSRRIVGWSRPSSAQQPSRTKGVTLLGRVFGMLFMSPSSAAIRARAQETSVKQLCDLNVTQICSVLAFPQRDPNARVQDRGNPTVIGCERVNSLFAFQLISVVSRPDTSQIVFENRARSLVTKTLFNVFS